MCCLVPSGSTARKAKRRERRAEPSNACDCAGRRAMLRPCYGSLFLLRARSAREKGDHNMGARYAGLATPNACAHVMVPFFLHARTKNRGRASPAKPLINLSLYN